MLIAQIMWLAPAIQSPIHNQSSQSQVRKLLGYFERAHLPDKETLHFVSIPHALIMICLWKVKEFHDIPIQLSKQKFPIFLPWKVLILQSKMLVRSCSSPHAPSKYNMLTPGRQGTMQYNYVSSEWYQAKLLHESLCRAVLPRSWNRSFDYHAEFLQAIWFCLLYKYISMPSR